MNRKKKTGAGKILCVGLCLMLLFSLSGCRYSDVLEQIVHDQIKSREVDHKSTFKPERNNRDNTTETEKLKDLETSPDAESQAEPDQTQPVSGTPVTPSSGAAPTLNYSPNAAPAGTAQVGTPSSPTGNSNGDAGAEAVAGGANGGGGGGTGNNGTSYVPPASPPPQPQQQPPEEPDSPEPEPPQEPEEPAKPVVDPENGEPPAELPEGVNSIAATGQAALLSLIAGGADILVATDDTTKANAAASGAFGGLADTASLWRNTGSGGITDADFQTLLQMKPDAVLEISGDAAISGSQAAQLEAAGISYVPLPQMTSVESIRQAAGVLGEMIADRSGIGGKNGKQQAKNYANWVDSIYDKVEKSTKDYKTKVDSETGNSYGTCYTLYINGWDPTAAWSVTNTGLSGNGAAYVFNAATASTVGITTFLGYANIINTSSKYGIQPQSKYLTPLYLGKSAQQSWNINGVSGSGYYQGQEKLLEQDAASLGTGNFKTILVPDAGVKQAIESDRDSGNGLWSVYEHINTGDGGFNADGFRDQSGGIVRTQISDSYNVVVNPKGLMSDWVSGGPEGILESLWAAHQYFDAVTEDELRQKMKDFYNTYYEMTVTDAQIDALLAG